MRKFTAVPGKGIFAAEDTKRDIMELPTSERCDLINQLKNETSASFISIDAVKDYFEKFGYDASDYSLDQFNSDWEDAKTITKRDIMELPTSERLRVISDMLDKYPSGISTEAAMKYLEDHGWDTSNYPTEQFDSDWDDYAKYYDEDEYDDDEYDEDDSIDWIETRADARRWLNEKQKKYGSTYFFPDEERYKLDRLIEKFGNTYFWDREALED